VEHQDFGETLADIRDHFDVPLTIRVQQWRVFGTAVIMTLGFVAVLLRGSRHLPPAVMTGYPNFSEEADRVFDAFKRLDGLRCNQMQVQQARELFGDLMTQRQQRHAHEMMLWLGAVQAGIFLSSLAMTLLLVSAIMAVWTNHNDTMFLVIFLAIQAIASVICYKTYLS
jgi:hypothetical protein